MYCCARADATRRTLHPQVHCSLSFILAYPSLSSHSSFWVLAHFSPPPRPSPEQAGSFAASPSSLLPFPLWAPGRCVVLKQALLIEHLFRRGAGSAACGQAAGGVQAGGDIMSHYISWYVLFTCLPAHLRCSHRTTLVPQPAPALKFPACLATWKKTSGGWFQQHLSCELEVVCYHSCRSRLWRPFQTWEPEANILAGWHHRSSQTESAYPDNHHTSPLDGQTCQSSRCTLPIDFQPWQLIKQRIFMAF